MGVHSTASNGEPCCSCGHQGINVSPSLLIFVLFITLLWGFVTSDRKNSSESEVSLSYFNIAIVVRRFISSLFDFIAFTYMYLI